jgi:hypothetical protein
MTDAWPWLTFAGLGAFHGLNPAMGWLFAVALGLHRKSRAIVMASLVPIAIGHAASISVVGGLLAIGGVLIPHNLMRMGSGLLLLAWAAYHWRFAHRHRVRFGMQVGLGGLAVWSFLIATAHGAGLMLWPVFMASCISTTSSGVASPPCSHSLAGVGPTPWRCSSPLPRCRAHLRMGWPFHSSKGLAELDALGTGAAQPAGLPGAVA